MSTIEVSNIVFEYPGKLALDDVSFSIKSNSITALVGPDGAGKTTLLTCMAALARPLSGNIIVDDEDILSEPRRYHQKIGYLADFFGLYEELTVAQCLKYVGLAHNISEDRIQECIEETATLVEIENHLNKKSKTLSRGLRQRLAIGQTLIHDPEILFLDEPSSGLDPEARYQFSKLLLKLSREGKTIIVSSHILSELEDYATHMLVLREGKIQEHSKINEPDSSDKRNLILNLATPFEGTGNILKSIDSIFEVKVNGLFIEFIFDGDSHAQYQLVKHLIENGVPVCSISDSKIDLQEVYVKKYGSKDVRKALPNEN
jgi:ABC-2 type transport system ATP-binding protein